MNHQSSTLGRRGAAAIGIEFCSVPLHAKANRLIFPQMSLEVKIPAVGESITSGVIAAWHKKDGDIVQANEPILTLETDKVSSEIVASGSGRLTLQAKEGDEVKIGQTVALIEEGVAAPAAAGSSAAPTDPAPNKLAPAPEPAPVPTAEAKTQNLAPAGGSGGDDGQRQRPPTCRFLPPCAG